MELADIRKERIIFTTIDLINEQGIQAVSTREVAKRQGISHGTVFQYFPKKKDLLYAVLEHYSLYDNDLFNTTKIRNMKSREAIIYYIDTYITYYENYPAITAVAQAYDVLPGDPELGGKVKSIFATRAEFMKELIEDAKNSGDIRKDADSECLSDIITSTMRGITLKWRISGCNFSLREKTMQSVNMILDTFSS